MYDTINKQALIENIDELQKLFCANSNFHERAARFICAAGSLYSDAERGAFRCIVDDKLEKYAKSITQKHIQNTSTKKGIETLRFSSAITPIGIVNYAHDNAVNSKKIYLFDDKFGAATHILLDHLRIHALSKGHDITISRSPMAPYDKIDMLEIPELSLCFVLSSYLVPTAIENSKVVNMLRFYDKTALAQNKNRMSFSRKATQHLLSQASSLIADAKSVHDEIEGFYKSNINFTLIREREDQILDDLNLL